MRILILIIAIVGLGTAGCTSAELLRQASINLRCPADKLDVTEITDTTSEVRGCGRRATFVEMCGVCTGTDCGCDWAMSDQGVR